MRLWSIFGRQTAFAIYLMYYTIKLKKSLSNHAVEVGHPSMNMPRDCAYYCLEADLFLEGCWGRKGVFWGLFYAFSGGLIIIFITQLDGNGVWWLSMDEEIFGCEQRCWEWKFVPHLFWLAWKSREFGDFVDAFSGGHFSLEYYGHKWISMV